MQLAIGRGAIRGFLKRSSMAEDWRSVPAGIRAPAHRGSVAVGDHRTRVCRRLGAETEDARNYVDTHITRLAKTLEITPPGGPRIQRSWRWAHTCRSRRRSRRSWAMARCAAATTASSGVPIASVQSDDGETFECDVDLFDAEKDRFPYPDEYFATVLCCELIEHLPADPMHLMSEVNRILKPGGHLVLTTPNIVSARAIAAILQGYHPGFLSCLHQACRARSRGRRAARARIRAARDHASVSGFRLRNCASRNGRVSR